MPSRNTPYNTLLLLPKLLYALPLTMTSSSASPEPISRADFYFSLALSVFLVLLGGIFAGLTLALMGQDEVNLRVIESSGDRNERRYAKNVLKLLARSKHWVLVTLLLANVITNESLPIVLHKCTGGGVSAVVSSTAAIVVFGEVIPQSLCARYGLEIGSFFAPFVLILMYILYPVAYPTAYLLDLLLGEDHGTIYKKAGLKTLVTLHQTMGVERLSTDEVTIILLVLDLKEKRVESIMTPMDNVFTMSSDTIVDEKMVDKIFNNGFSRIPIHVPGQPKNFIGMLLVRILINYDPEDAIPVLSFPLATLPETPPDTTCLNILNYFQEGKSHMVVVSKSPGSIDGALGILTLEDVIEELIGEEIVDETDVFVDIHNAIKRTDPGPLSKKHVTQYFHSLVKHSLRDKDQKTNTEPTETDLLIKTEPNGDIKSNGYAKDINYGTTVISNSKRPTTSTHIVVSNGEGETVAVTRKPRIMVPSNPAKNPLDTKKSYVTIKRSEH